MQNMKIRYLEKIGLFLSRYIFAFFSCVYLFLIGFLFVKNRLFINKICENFGFYKRKSKVSRIKLSKIVDGRYPIRVVEMEGVDGNMPISELAILNLLAKQYNPNSIFEIGTFDGRATLNLAVNSLPDAKVYTIDLPTDTPVYLALPITSGDKVYIDKNVRGERFRNKDKNEFPEKNKIVQLYGDTATFDFTPYFNKIDMVFVDGAHSYEYVLNDSKIALKLLRGDKGVIIWHDYASYWDGVTAALNELQLQNPRLNLLHIENTSLVILAVL